MAACGSLQHIFENPLPENPTLIESLSWNQIKSVKPIEHSFTEIFGELHFKENSKSSSSSSPLPRSSSSSLSSSLIDSNPLPKIEKLNNNNNKNEENNKSSSLDSFSSTHKSQYVGSHKNSDSFSSMNSESLQLCTEGLGFESSDDVEDLDLKNKMSNDWQSQEEKVSITKHSPSENLCGEFRRSRTSGGAFPPPISCIGKSGKPWVCFKPYRQDGRFVLKEIRIPTQEFLHACREDGRLKLHFVQPDDEILEEEEEEEEEDQDEVQVVHEENETEADDDGGKPENKA